MNTVNMFKRKNAMGTDFGDFPLFHPQEEEEVEEDGFSKSQLGLLQPSLDAADGRCGCTKVQSPEVNLRLTYSAFPKLGCYFNFEWFNSLPMLQLLGVSLWWQSNWTGHWFPNLNSAKPTKRQVNRPSTQHNEEPKQESNQQKSCGSLLFVPSTSVILLIIKKRRNNGRKSDQKISRANRVNYQFLTLFTSSPPPGGGGGEGRGGVCFTPPLHFYPPLVVVVAECPAEEVASGK